MDLAVLAKLPIGAVTSWQHAIQPEDLTERVFSPLTRRSGTLARYRRDFPPLPSARRPAARDRAEQAGTPSDGGSCRPAVCARHKRYGIRWG